MSPFVDDGGSFIRTGGSAHRWPTTCLLRDGKAAPFCLEQAMVVLHGMLLGCDGDVLMTELVACNDTSLLQLMTYKGTGAKGKWWLQVCVAARFAKV